MPTLRFGGILRRLVRRGQALCTAANKAATEVHTVGPLTLRVSPGEALGLVGVSGCGKSLTLAALAGTLQSEARVGGEARVNGKQMIGRVLKPGEVGYCPPENCCSQNLTVREQVSLFARLRGIDQETLASEVSSLLKSLDLEAFEYVCSENLSGGNHRKLQVACALVGSPNFICLDEPSNGLDPVARRALWSTVQAKLRLGSVVVVATKSITEAEALCSKLAFLNKEGELRTLGSAQEIRSRYGGGHELRVSLRRPSMAGMGATTELLSEDTEVVREEIHLRNLAILSELRPLFPAIEMVEAVSLTCVYQLHDERADLSSTKWGVADIFQCVEDRKETLQIADYSIAQASLEHVFNLLARQSQRNETSGPSVALAESH